MKYFWFFGAVILLILAGILGRWQFGVAGSLWLQFALVEKLKEEGL